MFIVTRDTVLLDPSKIIVPADVLTTVVLVVLLVYVS